MEAQRAVVGFLAAYQEVWCRYFPDLHRRGHWHLVSHLCVRSRDGAPVGELSGMVKQVFLLDDATVRERLGELGRLGFCLLDPADRPVAARTVILPTPSLKATFDQHLRDAAAALLDAVRMIDPPLHAATPAAIDGEARRRMLDAIERCDEAWLASLEQLLEELGLSVARRIEARRHLLSPSHRALTLLALRHRSGLLPGADADGILADDMAAELLRLQRQNFQTTRDHISALIQLGVLERRSGRALRVALTDRAEAEFAKGLASAGDALVQAAAPFIREDATEQTSLSHRLTGKPHAQSVELAVTRDGEPVRRVALGAEPLIIGRAPSSNLVLADSEVSRAHCRIALLDGEISVTDLNSTNGSFIDGKQIAESAILPPGALLQIGPFVLARVVPSEDDADGTIRPARTQTATEGA